MDGHIELLHADISSRILTSCFEVYRIRGYGFLENIYKNSVAVELALRGSTVRREVPVEVNYKGQPVGTYRIDILVDSCVLLEVKTQNGIGDADVHQLMNYLRASGVHVGLLFNFGPKPAFARRVYSASTQTFFNPRD